MTTVASAAITWTNFATPDCTGAATVGPVAMEVSALKIFATTFTLCSTHLFCSFAPLHRLLFRQYDTCICLLDGEKSKIEGKKVCKDFGDGAKGYMKATCDGANIKWLIYNDAACTALTKTSASLPTNPILETGSDGECHAAIGVRTGQSDTWTGCPTISAPKESSAGRIVANVGGFVAASVAIAALLM